MKRFHPSARATTVPRRASTGRLQVRVESLEFAGKSWPAGEGMGLKSPGTDKRLVQDATDREARAALSSNEAERERSKETMAACHIIRTPPGKKSPESSGQYGIA